MDRADDTAARRAIEAALERGETIRFAGAADLSRSPFYGAAGWSPFWLWIGFAGLFEGFALVAFFALWRWEAAIYVGVGALFIGIGLGLLLRERARRRQAGRLRFVVTDRRAFSIDPHGAGALSAMAIASILYAEANRRSDGAGDIEFGCGEPGAPASAATHFHHWRGVGDIAGAMSALERAKRDGGERLTRAAPDD